MVDKNLDYNLDIEEELTEKPKLSKNIKIILGILSGIIIVLIGVIIYLGITNNDLRNKSKDTPTDTPQPFINTNPYTFFGVQYPNISYSENNKIENTFKSSGINYNPDIGILNNDLDYEANDRNIYDLYIPTFALERKEQINGIILWIHGGAWKKNDKSIMSLFCELYGQLGFISVTMGYTLLTKPYKDYSIYKNMDEITACIKSIKKELKAKEFKEDKLRFALAGYSSGAHLALLYSYLMKNIDINNIKIDFLINIVGPMGLDPEYYYFLTNFSEPLNDIENKTSIKKALEEGKLIKMPPGVDFLNDMNMFLGDKYSTEEINSIIENGKINNESDIYKKMYNAVKYSYIPLINDNNKIKTLCIYAGADEMIGEAHYSYLKEKAENDGRILEFVYMKYESHMFIMPDLTKEPQAIRNMSALITKNLYKYFINDNDNDNNN